MLSDAIKKLDEIAQPQDVIFADDLKEILLALGEPSENVGEFVYSKLHKITHENTESRLSALEAKTYSIDKKVYLEDCTECQSVGGWWNHGDFIECQVCHNKPRPSPAIPAKPEAQGVEEESPFLTTERDKWAYEVGFREGQKRSTRPDVVEVPRELAQAWLDDPNEDTWIPLENALKKSLGA